MSCSKRQTFTSFYFHLYVKTATLSFCRVVWQHYLREVGKFLLYVVANLSKTLNINFYQNRSSIAKVMTIENFGVFFMPTVYMQAYKQQKINNKIQQLATLALQKMHRYSKKRSRMRKHAKICKSSYGSTYTTLEQRYFSN